MKKHLFLSLLLGALLTIGTGGPALAQHHAHQGHDEHAGEPAHAHGQDATAGEAAGHAHQMSSLHGGQVAMTEQHHFETVFTPGGVRIYGYTGKQAPMKFEDVTGTATFKFKDGTRKDVPLAAAGPGAGEPVAYFCPMHPEATKLEPGTCDKCGGMKLMPQNSLFGGIDLSGVKPGELKVVINLKGFQDQEPSVAFTESFQGMTRHGEPAGKPQHDSGGRHTRHNEGGSPHKH